MNRIHGLILAAVASNTQSVLTDCPHREKLGWLEQTHLLGKSLMYNYDLSQVYEKIAYDMQDTQLVNGLVPDIAPEYVQFEKGFRDSPEWGSASILALWIHYQQYGDRRILANHYRMMKRYAEYLASRAKEGIISYGLGDWYDIGPGEPGESKLTARGLTATAIYYQDLTALQRVASLLGKRPEAAAYSRKAAQVRKAFNAKLFNAQTHQYDAGSQTANAMPLAIGLVPDSERAAVLANLVEDIRKHNNHVTAGDVGFLCRHCASGSWKVGCAVRYDLARRQPKLRVSVEARCDDSDGSLGHKSQELSRTISCWDTLRSGFIAAWLASTSTFRDRIRSGSSSDRPSSVV